MAVCPKCHQQIAVERLGVRMPPFKARIVDHIKAAGDIGLSSRELRNEIYRGYLRHRTASTVRTHIGQINSLLVETDWLIASEGRGPQARWYLVHRPLTQEAAE